MSGYAEEILDQQLASVIAVSVYLREINDFNGFAQDGKAKLRVKQCFVMCRGKRVDDGTRVLKHWKGMLVSIGQL